jgi:hypothetical protein
MAQVTEDFLSKRTFVPICLALVFVLTFAVVASLTRPATVDAAHTAEPSANSSPVPYVLAYSKDGDLTPPLQYREWIYLTSGLDMSYTAKPSDMSIFDNVFVNPEAYRSLLTT